SDRAEDKSTASDRRAEFVVPIADSSLCNESKTTHQCSFEQKNAHGKTDKRDQTRSADGQANVTRAQNRPKRDCKHNHRQQNEYRHGPKRRCSRRIAAREQSKERSANCANDELTSYRRANAELLEMIVTADFSHNGKKRTGWDENRKTIADNEKRRSSAALQNVTIICQLDSRFRFRMRRCPGPFQRKLPRSVTDWLGSTRCCSKNFLYAFHYHRRSNLLHACVIKRALAQATVIAWRTG